MFGVVVGIGVVASYAAGQPTPPVLTRPPGATKVLVPELSPDEKIAFLEKRATADAARLHALEVAVRNLQYAVSHLPPPPPNTAPFCSSPTVSSNPQGGSRNCSPLRCDGAAGTCIPRCNSIDDCAPNFACNLSGDCVWNR
jgi:hypothetical protein